MAGYLPDGCVFPSDLDYQEQYDLEMLDEERDAQFFGFEEVCE